MPPASPSSKDKSGTGQFTLRSTVFSAPAQPAGLYLVATPIGNLGDITIRALETLAGCDVIACEDTRTSGVLLKRFGIDRPKVSYNEHNANRRGPDLLRQIADGAAVALISDAGTPLVSDPGGRLVEQALDQGLKVIPIPGASAPIAALIGSGFGNEDFRFCGFLPSRKQARRQQLEALKAENTTLIFFESPTRITASLMNIKGCFGSERKMTVAREISKMHETFHRGTVAELCHEFESMDRVRGEIVLVIEAAEAESFSDHDVDDLLSEALKEMKTKQAANSVAQKTGLSKQDLYARALALKAEKAP